MESGIPTYTPSLVFSHGEKQTIYSLFTGSYDTQSVPELQGSRCICSCQGWSLMRGYSSTECYLYDPISSEKIHLPVVPKAGYRSGVMTSTPSDPNCLVVLYSQTKNSIVFCRIGCTEWIEQDLKRKKKVYYEDTRDHKLICCRRKIYLFIRAELRMEEIDIHDTYATVKSYVGGPPLLETRLASDNFVEFGGEIFQVLLFKIGASKKIIQTARVYRLDFSTMDWVMVDTLGDRIFLLGLSSTSVSAKELGLEGNCIYFTDYETTSVCRFNMDSGTISSDHRQKLPHLDKPFWVVPNFGMQVHERVLNKSSPTTFEVEDELNEERSWKYLPEELLDLILSSLSFADIARFRLTCKNWKYVRQHQRLFLTQSNSNPKNIPFLLSLPRSKTGLCNLYRPICNDVSYFHNNSEIEGAVVRDAKYGWLLMTRGTEAVFFFNPLTSDIIELPDVDDEIYISISFSAPPTSSYCVVFGLLDPDCNEDHMVVFRKHRDESAYDDEDEFFDESSDDEDGDIANHDYGDKFWSVVSYSDLSKIPDDDEYSSVLIKVPSPSIPIKVPSEFVAADTCNSVFCKGKFFVLGKDGKLGCFNPYKRNRDRIWRILPPGLSFSQATNQERSFLIGNNEDIYSVFIDHVWGESVHVYKLNWKKLAWVEVESLGDYVLFLSPARSMLAPAAIKGMGNRIYFPKICSGDSTVYYSLSTRNYHFGSNSHREGRTSCSELWNCSWIDFNEQPLRRVKSSEQPSKLYSLFLKIWDFILTS